MPAINPTHQFLDYPKAEIGSYAANLAHLASQDIPLPNTYCVPVSTLKLIAQHNYLTEKFEAVVGNIQLNSQEELEKTVKKIQKFIREQAFPSTVSKKLLELYQQHFNSDYIRLTASPVDGYPLDYKREDNIQGEANMMESILKLWARNIDPSDIKRKNLFPVAIIIQSQFQPSSSGLAFSLDTTTGDKSRITIQGVYGVFSADRSSSASDYFFIDRRTWKQNDKNISSKKKALVRSPDLLKTQTIEKKLQDQPILNNIQTTELAQLVNKIKLQYTHQILIHWELIDSNFLITKIKPYSYEGSLATSKQQLHAVVIGQSVTAGYIQGHCQIFSSPNQIKTAKPGFISVIKELNNEYQALIFSSSAIICEQRIANPNLLAKIRHFQLPCIILAKNATKILSNNQIIVLDASAGKVYLEEKNSAKIKKHKQAIELLLAINDASELNENSAIISHGVGMIRSEHFLIKTGLHPEQIIKTKKEQFIDNTSNELSNLYHRFYSLNHQLPIIAFRSNNLNTNQLLQLQSGDVYEQEEKNPFLGLRGAIRAIRKPHLFNIELEIISKTNSRVDQPMSFILPFVRTNFELQQLYAKIEKQFVSPVYQPPLWLQLNTPENLLNIKEYLNTPLSGVCINLKTIHALFHGVDPSMSDLYNQYPMNLELLTPYLSSAIKTMRASDSNLKIYIVLSDFNQATINYSLKNQVNGLILRPDLALQINEYLLSQ